MITINFFNDGAYAKGHDTLEVCSVVSYAIGTCIRDCLNADSDVWYFESAAQQDEWERLGFTYIKINSSVKEHTTIFERFKRNIILYANTWYPDRIKISDNPDEPIDWHAALNDAKIEQGIKEANHDQ